MTTDLYADLVAHNDTDFFSDSIETVGYDRINKVLFVEFQSGPAVYAYDDVEESTYNLFVAADSLNAFWRAHIAAGNGSVKHDYAYINEREPEDEGEADVSGFSVGDRVLVTYDAANNAFGVWDGPATVVRIHDGYCVIVRTDEDERGQSGKEGGFFPNELSLIEKADDSVDLKPNVKWATNPDGDSPVFAEGENDLFTLDNLFDGGNALTIQTQPTARFSVSWESTDGKVGGKPEFTDFNESGALRQFHDAMAAAAKISDTFADYKVTAVTHYFD